MAEDMLYTDESNGQEYLAVEKTTHAENKHQVVTPAEDDNSVVMSDKLLVRNAEDEIVWKMPQDLSEYAKLSDLSANVKLAFVDELPEEPEENVIYLVKKEDGEDPNIYNEYLYHEDSGFELIGDTSTDVDLSDLERKINNLETELPKKANGNHVHGFIQNDGTFDNNVQGGNRNQLLGTGDRLLIAPKDNGRINATLPFVEKENIAANQYLSRDGRWKEFATGKQIESEDASKGWLGNVEIEVPASASEIFGYILTGGIALAGVNKDIIPFSITRQSLKDMYSIRIDKADKLFHVNLTVPLLQSGSDIQEIDARIKIDITKALNADNTWNDEGKISLSMIRCIAFRINTIFPGRSEEFNYISGRHFGHYSSKGVHRGYYYSNGGEHHAVSNGTEIRYQVQVFDSNGYIAGATAAPQWNGEWIGSGHWNACYSGGIKFFEGNSDKQGDIEDIKINDGSESISASNKTDARIFVYYK